MDICQDYITVTAELWWGEKVKMQSFSMAMGRIAYIVGDKQDFLSKC